MKYQTIVLILVALFIICFHAVLVKVITIQKTQELPENFPIRVTIPSEPPKPTLYVDLSDNLQKYASLLCEANRVPFELVVAIMDVESGFNSDAISEGGDYGLMQVNKVNHRRLSETLGVTDFLDPKQNIKCGVHMLSELFTKYEDVNKVLMAYNLGEYGAKKKWAQGVGKTNYSEKVVKRMEELS